MGAGRPKSIDNSKVFDVAKPGKTKPLSTSRPVVGQTITVRDNSMLTTQPTEEENTTLLSSPSVTRKIIKPLTEADQATESKSAPVKSVANFTETAPELMSTAVASTADESSKKVTKKLQIVDSTANDTVTVNKSTLISKQSVAETATLPDKTVEEQPTPDVTSNDAEKEEASPAEVQEKTDVEPDPSLEKPTEAAAVTQTEEKPAQAESATEGSESASVDALAEASEKPKLDQKALEEQAKRDAALQELIDSKKYFVALAHDSSQNKKSNGVGFIVLILLLVVLAAYLLVDAEIIKTNISLPYQFFK